VARQIAVRGIHRGQDALSRAIEIGRGESADDQRYRDLTAVVGDDPLPYGIKANLPAIETLIDTRCSKG